MKRMIASLCLALLVAPPVLAGVMYPDRKPCDPNVEQCCDPSTQVCPAPSAAPSAYDLAFALTLAAVPVSTALP
jgi:hypothetical protein